MNRHTASGSHDKSLIFVNAKLIIVQNVVVPNCWFPQTFWKVLELPVCVEKR